STQYTRRETKAGEVTLKVPKLRHLPFETQIIERYRRRESSVKKPWWRCIWLECRCDESRTLPKLVGHAGEVVHGGEAQPKDLPAHRGVAPPRDCWCVRVRASGRHRSEALLGG